MLYLTKNEINDIIKVVRSLEIKGISSKGTTRKITSQKGGFLNFVRPLMTAGLPLIKNVLMPLAKNVLLPFGLLVGTTAADVAVQNKFYRWGITALIILNEEMDDIMEIVKSLEESGLSVKRKKVKQLKIKQKRRISSNVIRNNRKYINRKSSNKSRRKQNQIRWRILMPSDSLNNFEIQKYYQDEPTFNGVYSKNNLPKIKDRAYIINLYEYESKGTHWIALYVIAKNVTYFDSFRVKHNIFHKKLENSLKIKIFQQIFMEYKYMIQ